MDKRTIFFILALSLSMFLVNYYFEEQNKESVREWNLQQQSKKLQSKQQLEAEIAKNTATSDQLPLVRLYASPESSQVLTSGVKSGEAIITLPWASNPLEKIYGEDKEAYSLSNSSAEGPLIYKKNAEARLSIIPLPEFGRYDLQVVSLNQDSAYPVQIALGTLIDGHFSIAQERLYTLQKELNEENTAKSPISDSIVLLKSGETYLPSGFYKSGTRSLLSLADIPELAPSLAKIQKKIEPLSGKKSQEQFYVLETPYQQLVFSNYGGALSEINLPFQNESNQKSVVKEIEFDREMVQLHPYNAQFPTRAYYSSNGFPDQPLVEHNETKLGGYYPLIRRNLVETGKKKSLIIPPKFYALNIISEYPETAEMIYELKKLDDRSIVFEATQAHRKITKTFSVAAEKNGISPYCFDLTIKVEGDARGLWLTSGVPEIELISGSPSPTLKFRITRNQKADVELIDLPKDSTTVSSIYPDWLCNSNGFFGVILDPLTDIDPGFRAQFISGIAAPSRLLEIDQDIQRFKPDSLPGYMTLVPLKNSGGVMEFRIFAGPFADSVLTTVDKAYSDAAIGYDPDYIACQSFHGWFSFISQPFAKFLFILISFFHTITGSWALSIILLTVALRLMLYPLNAWSTKSMLKMQQIAPQVTAIQEKYKKDPKKAQLEIMNLYRDKGVNPVSGCFPLLIQMPFLIGMFDLLKSTFELRGASFIPGWIDNLTAPDVLFSWSTPLPLIGNQFHLLPILTGIVMYLQQRVMSPLPKDPSLLTEQQRQQKFMGNIMAVVFCIMFYNFPSGLNIYFLSSMLLGILQQVWTARKMKKAPEVIVKPKNL